MSDYCFCLVIWCAITYCLIFILFYTYFYRDKVVDFHWNASDPWTIVSVSDDCDTTGGGGTLQVYTLQDFLYFFLFTF